MIRGRGRVRNIGRTIAVCELTAMMKQERKWVTCAWGSQTIYCIRPDMTSSGLQKSVTSSINVAYLASPHLLSSRIPASSELNQSRSKLIYRISYPTWGGAGIGYDPTYVAYHVPTLSIQVPPGCCPAIIIYPAVALAVIAAITAFLV